MEELIFTKEELKRIRKCNRNGEPVIVVDLHEMSKKMAKRFLKNIVCINPGIFTLQVIHGFNRGTVLKEAIREGNFCNRINKIIPDKSNSGCTFVSIYASPAI